MLCYTLDLYDGRSAWAAPTTNWKLRDDGDDRGEDGEDDNMGKNEEKEEETLDFEFRDKSRLSAFIADHALSVALSLFPTQPIWCSYQVILIL